MHDPTIGALKYPVNVSLEARRAVHRRVRQLKLGLYVFAFRLRIKKLLLKVRYSLLIGTAQTCRLAEYFLKKRVAHADVPHNEGSQPESAESSGVSKV